MGYHEFVGDGLRLEDTAPAGGGVTLTQVQTHVPTPTLGEQQGLPSKNKGQDLLRMLQAGKQVKPAQHNQSSEAYGNGGASHMPTDTNPTADPWQSSGSDANNKSMWGTPGTGLGNGLMAGSPWGEFSGLATNTNQLATAAVPGLTGFASIWGPARQTTTSGSPWGKTVSHGSTAGGDGNLDTARPSAGQGAEGSLNTSIANYLAHAQQQQQQQQQLQQAWQAHINPEPLIPRQQHAAPHVADWQRQSLTGWQQAQELLQLQGDHAVNAVAGNMPPGFRMSAGGGVPAQALHIIQQQQQQPSMAGFPSLQPNHQPQQAQQQVEQASGDALARLLARMAVNPQQLQHQQQQQARQQAADVARAQQQGILGAIAARGPHHAMATQWRGPAAVQVPAPINPLSRAPGRPMLGVAPSIGRGKLRPWDVRLLESQLQSLAASLLPSQVEQLALAQAVDGVERLLRNDFPQGVVKLYGSAANGLCITRTNDIDVCLDLGPNFDTDTNKAEVVAHLGRLLQDAGMENVVALPRARVPVVKFVYPSTGTSVDITVNNFLPLENTRLLATYAATDPRLRALVLIVKHWAKTRGVNDTYRGSLSSYAYVLMCIGLLQQRNPPILPKLQQMQPRQQRSIAGWDVSFCDDLEQLRGFGTGNTESLCDLVDAFFTYYGTQHDYNNSVLSIRVGGLISKRAKDWVRRQDRDRHLVCIEDPFELSHDLGRCVDWQSVRTLRGEFERAAQIMAVEPDPLPLLLQPSSQ